MLFMLYLTIVTFQFQHNSIYNKDYCSGDLNENIVYRLL